MSANASNGGWEVVGSKKKGQQAKNRQKKKPADGSELSNQGMLFARSLCYILIIVIKLFDIVYRLKK